MKIKPKIYRTNYFSPGKNLNTRQQVIITMLKETEEVVEKEFNVDELNQLREKIESMSKFNQIEVLRILSKFQDLTLNENKYGIHVNLSEVSDEVIESLKMYTTYVDAQETNLNLLEKQKEDFKNIYFAKDNKDNTTKISI
jgi:hypothetical protein